ncbi:MAG: BamA/TamA family outer membrane protein [Flavitalea sp.]
MHIRKIIISILTILCAFGWVSCNNTKYLPAKESLYIGSKVKINKPVSYSNKKKKALSKELNLLTRPKPNSSILGLRPKLWFWNIGGTPKHKISIRRLIKKLGEPPVVLSDLNLEKTSIILQNHLENSGYFRSAVTGEVTIKNKRATATYTAVTGERYTINKVVFMEDSSMLQKNINNTKKRSLLKKGEPFDLEVVKAERERIDARLKQRGFYFFDPSNIIVDVDSTTGNHLIDIYVNTKSQTPQQARRIYRINDIVIYSRFNVNGPARDTSRRYGVMYDDYYVIDSSKFYKPKLFRQAMQFSKNDIYNRGEHNATLNRLINLGIFKFVKNRFETQGDTLLNAYYYLTPLPKKSLRIEIGGLTKSNNLTGSQVTLGFTNRNALKGGEILNVNLTGGSEVQYSGQYRGFNTYNFGAEANLAIPRFVIPFIYLNPRGGFVPRTNIQLGYDVLKRQKLYTLNSFRGAFGYIWKESPQKEHTFYPITVQYVQPMNVSQIYRDSIKTDETLRKVVDTQFILGASYNYLFNQLVGRVQDNAFYFNGTVDISGNIAGLIKKSVIKSGDTARLFGAPFSQYLKMETDFRYYKNIGGRNTWVNRIDIGVGFPYGNSSALPFIKQFFIGGNNSLRAFRSRSLGPGLYRSKSTNTKGFVPDQSGDIKLEMNTELRFKLFSPIYGAVFVDAGNIWLYNPDPNKPNAQFTKAFLTQLAAGTGIGLRVDISILVLRLDVAFPIRQPWLLDGSNTSSQKPENPWVIDKINFGSSIWRKENLVFNLAIGYPF